MALELPGILRWTALAEDGPDHLRVTGEPLPPRPVTALDPPSRLLAAIDAVLAVVELHREGIAHGNLDPELFGATPTGRVRLPWPAPTDVRPPSDDGPALAAVLDTWSLDPTAASLLDALRDGDDVDALAAALRVQTGLAFGDRRYRGPRPLGEGGMGVVYAVEDGLLHRRVALKRLKPGIADAGRFVAEAQLTAQLQHPGIVPVHTLGEDEEGRPFYTMEIVDGQTLAEVLARGRTTLARLVDVLVRVCDAVAYAHERGVVHRDLKPSNIMVGRHGEVRVMDWGIAKVLDVAAPALRTVRTEGEGTVAGRVAGSPGYLAPEVGPHNPGDQRRDVYALGLILRELWGDADAPATLAGIADRCTAPDPADRPDDAAAVAAALRDWLDGLARRRLAEASVGAALPLLEAAETTRAEAAALRRRAAAALEDVRPWSPLDDKRDAWSMEDRAAALDVEARVIETRYEQGLRGALDHDPDLPEALARVADLYKAQLERAEAAGARLEIARLRTLLADHEGGRHRAWLDQGGRLTLRTDPPGARAWLERYVESGRRLVPEPIRELGTTPLTDVPIDRGSLRIRIEHPDTEPVVYPVLVGRGTHWTSALPDGDRPVALPPRGSLGPGDRFVPAGWFVSGGDPDAVDGLPRAWRWVDGFVIRRHPVTVAEYTRFLDAVVARGDDPGPYVPAAPSTLGERPLLARRDDAWIPTDEAVGPRALEADWPITSVTWHAARAYAAWRAEVEGLPWRLPHDQEWEKAARGVDGRTYPWGAHLDGRFACSLESHEGPPTIHPVHAFALDESPYGVRGLAGNVRDWCLNGYRRDGPPDVRIVPDAPPEGPYRTMRGGSYTSQAVASRCATRLVERPNARILAVGFRLVRSAP